jgi:hypothetical protein
MRHETQYRDKFCPKCGASRAAAKTKDDLEIGTGESELAALEKSVAQEPTNDGFKQRLALAYHDDALRFWVRDPEEQDKYLCVSREGIEYARKQITRAANLNVGDAHVRGTVEKTIRLVNTMEERQFAGSWLMVVVLGLFYIIPGLLWWYVNRRPQYLINRDYIEHLRTGKHAGAGANWATKRTAAQLEQSNACYSCYFFWALLMSIGETGGHC